MLVSASHAWLLAGVLVGWRPIIYLAQRSRTQLGHIVLVWASRSSSAPRKGDGLPVTTSVQTVRWNAQDYAGHSQGQYRWGLSVVERLALRGTEWVLDVGCGDGKLTAEIARQVPNGRALGVDFAPDMVQFARTTHMPELDNVDFLLADAQSLNLDPAFDVAFSNSTMHWIPNHPAVLKGLFNALKPGGRIFLSMSGRGTAAVVLSAIADLAERAPWQRWLGDLHVPWYCFGPEEYAVWLPATGFTSRRVELVPRTMRQAGVAALEGWLRTAWMPYTERVPLDDREAFIAAVAHGVESRCATCADGAILLPMVNLEVEADKPVQPMSLGKDTSPSVVGRLSGRSEGAAVQDLVGLAFGGTLLRRPILRMRQLGFGGY